MSFAVSSGAALRMAVEPGDRVRAEGRFVQLDDADWLDLAQVDDLVLRTVPWKSTRSVRLVGADASAVPVAGRTADRSVVPDCVRVGGVWHDDRIDVETQSPVPWPTPQGRGPLLTLPAPAGGWDVAGQSRDVHGLEELRASGKIVRDGWLREDSGALILRGRRQ